MANHITNELRIEASPERIKEILEAIKNDEIGLGSIDFNKIIPMPPELDIEAGSRTTMAIEIYTTMKENRIRYMGEGEYDIDGEDLLKISMPEFLEKYGETIKSDPGIVKDGQQYCENTRKHGCATWYEWSIKNWGTKWNAYGFDHLQAYEEGSDTIFFQTAWSGSPQILRKISELYPNVTLHYRWADENIGYNVGTAVLNNGEVVGIYQPIRGSAEAEQLSCDILGYDPEEIITLDEQADGAGMPCKEEGGMEIT
jgi:hypothetical protein